MLALWPRNASFMWREITWVTDRHVKEGKQTKPDQPDTWKHTVATHKCLDEQTHKHKPNDLHVQAIEFILRPGWEILEGKKAQQLNTWPLSSFVKSLCPVLWHRATVSLSLLLIVSGSRVARHARQGAKVLEEDVVLYYLLCLVSSVLHLMLGMALWSKGLLKQRITV